MNIEELVSTSTARAIKNSSSFKLTNNEKGLCLQLENQKAYCEISLFGGHVLSFIPKHDNTDRLWLSDNAIFDSKTAIRGGIPVCWPWFSSHHLETEYPSHGYVRTQFWRIENIEESVENTYSKVTLSPVQSEMFAYDGLKCKLLIELNEKLELSLVTMNDGDKDVRVSQALHTYFRVKDIEKTNITGIKQTYFDKLDGQYNKQCPKNYQINQEVDRIHTFAHDNYTNTAMVKICDEQSNYKINIEQSGHDSTVVWNPWKDKSETMKDMSNEGYKTMLCIELANTDKEQAPLIIKPKQVHKLWQCIY